MTDRLLPLETAIVLIFLLVNGILYGFGSAMQNLNQKEIAGKADEGDEFAGKMLGMLENPGRFIGTLHAASGAVTLVAGAAIFRVAYIIFHRIRDGASGEIAVRLVLLVLGLFVFLVLLVSLSVVIPRKCAANSPESWCRRLYGPVLALIAVTTPLHRCISFFSRGVLSMFSIDPDADEEKVTEDDIRLMVSEGHEQGLLKDSEAEMVNNVFELDEKEAGDIMTHRKNIVALDQELTLNEAVDFILNQSNKSRLPVYRQNIDNIVGVLHIRDVLQFSEVQRNRTKRLRDIPGLLRQPHFIPETRKIDKLFHQMQKDKIHMVIVIDEYGQTSGLISMEDVLEEIVGNIEDEYDDEESLITRRPDGSFVIDGMASLEDVAQALDVEFDEEDLDNFETISGFLISRLDRIPEDGEQPVIAALGWVFRVHQVKNRVIRNMTALPAERRQHLPKADADGEGAEKGA